MAERQIVYTDEQRQAAADLVDEARRNHRWTIEELARASGVGLSVAGKMCRLSTEAMAFPYVVSILSALDIDVYQYARVLGLLDPIKERLEDFPNIGQSVAEADKLVIDLATLPEEKRGLAVKLVYGLVDSLK